METDRQGAERVGADGTGQMGEEGFNTLHSGADDETQLARVFGNGFSGCVGQLGTVGSLHAGKDRTQDGARHSEALPCSELVMKEERQRDLSTVVCLLKASCCLGSPSFGSKDQLWWKPKRDEGVGGKG